MSVNVLIGKSRDDLSDIVEQFQIPAMSVDVSISESRDDLSDVGESRSMISETITDFTDSVIDTNEKCWDITQDSWFNDVISDTTSSVKSDHLLDERGSKGSSANSSFYSLESIDRAEILKNFDIETALVHIKDLGYNEATEANKTDMVRMIKTKVFFSGENIIANSDNSSEMYFILCYSKTYIEIIHPDKSLSTKLKVGDYFGEQAFLTRKKFIARGYEARVFPSDNVSNYIIVGIVEPHNFNKFNQFRQTLLVRNIPLIEMIPVTERETLITNAEIVNYQDTDYIIKQGQLGEYLYAVIEGSVDVVEDIYTTNLDGDVVQSKKKLVTLRAGHIFGEMSLVTKKPAVANVISNGKSSCFTVSKTLLMSSLSAKSFESFLLDIVNKRKTIRSARTESMQKIQRSSSVNNRVSSDFNDRNTSVKVSTKASVKLIDIVKISKNSNGKKMINQYEIVNLLGKGTSGEVYLCKLTGDDPSPSSYAMKIIPVNREVRTKAGLTNNSIDDEISILCSIHHQNIVRVHEIFDDLNHNKVFIVFEYMAGGPVLTDINEDNIKYDIQLVKGYFRQLCVAVNHLHANGIVHRDIKPSNLLLDIDKKCIKLADFGSAVRISDCTNDKVAQHLGTPGFMAPELFLSVENNPNYDITLTFSTAIDIYAMGATLYVLLFGKLPFIGANEIDLGSEVRSKLQFSETIDSHLKHLLCNLLEKDPRVRFTMDQILSDDWLTDEGTNPIVLD